MIGHHFGDIAPKLGDVFAGCDAGFFFLEMVPAGILAVHGDKTGPVVTGR